MKHTKEEYYCDRCGKKLKTWANAIDLVTSLRETQCWARLHVVILHRHGMHNDATTERAELCKNCSVELLRDALNRALKGERASAGTEAVEELGWDQPF